MGVSTPTTKRIMWPAAQRLTANTSVRAHVLKCVSHRAGASLTITAVRIQLHKGVSGEENLHPIYAGSHDRAVHRSGRSVAGPACQEAGNDGQDESPTYRQEACR